MAAQNTIRIAAWNAGLVRDGPGRLLADILSDDDAEIAMAVAMLSRVAPDIVLLNNFDHDHNLVAAHAFADRLALAGLALPHLFALRPNSGVPTGHDVDGDGRLGEADDAQGYGTFPGEGGMVLLSRFPVLASEVQDYSGLLWANVPGSQSDDPPNLAAVQRLSSVGHWVVPVEPGTGRVLTVLAWHAGTPAFGRGSDRNARRNADETLFWTHYLAGRFGAVPGGPFVLLGSANLDPADGRGQRDVIRGLLAHPAVQDPAPKSRGAVEASALQGDYNARHAGDPALDTADWRDAGGPGNLRVQYVLPSVDLDVLDAGVFWPASDDPAYQIVSGRDPTRSWHGIVWVDVAWQPRQHGD